MRIIGYGLALMTVAGPGAVAAQTFTVQSIVPAQLGTVAAGASGVTVFQAYQGTLKISGSGAYISGTQTTSVVTIACAGACNGATARVYVTRTGVNTGRGQTIMDIGAVAGSGASITGPASNTSGTYDFTMTGWTAAGTLQFALGLRLPVLGDDSSTATTASSQFNVAVTKNPTVPSGGTASTISATVRKALTLAKSADLRFGTVIAPTTGSFNVYLSNTDGSRGTSPGGYAGNLVPSTYGPASYTISGEPGTAYSLTYPSTFTMTGPASLTVTLVGTIASGSQTVPAGGTAALVIGAYTPIAAGQQSGNYSGSYTVTLAYN